MRDVTGMDSPFPELQLLFACARVMLTHEDEGAIRQMLDDGIDWTRFAQKAVGHGLAGLAGHTLTRIAPDAVPDDILNAFRIIIDRTRRSNRARFEELADIVATLAKAGVEAIPFKGPVLAIQSYGDLGFRVFGDLDFLVRDADVAATIATLHSFGYERTGELTAAQFDLIHRLQGQEIIFNQATGAAVEPHTRLTPIKMALDIDYAGLRRRARPTNLDGRTMLTLAPEDDLLVLAIHGGKELWWNIKWACDFAAFVASHPQLDWTAATARARAQGCLRMVLLATSLARKYFNAGIPDAIVAAERADSLIGPIVERIMAHWQADTPVGPPSNKTLSMDRLWLHDGAVRRVRYTLRTMLMPGPHHVAAVPLPRTLGFAYIPIKIAHDGLALPLWRASLRAFAQARRWQDVLAGSGVPLALVPASADIKLGIKRNREACAEARRALAADADNATSWSNLGDALHGLKRYKEAIASYDKALAVEPDNPSFWRKRSAAAGAIGPAPDTAADTPEPNDVAAWAVLAGRLLDAKRFAEAAEAGDRAVALDPGNVAAARVGIQARLFACDWRKRKEDEKRITEGLRSGQRLIAPVFHRAICDSEAEHLLLSRLWANEFSPSPLWNGERYRHDKVRLAYISTDFRDHVVSDVIVGCFEHHDKARFETTAISLHPGDGSAMRRRVEAAFDRFIDVETVSNAGVAAMLRELEIDIAIDLNGNSGAKRTGILARRPSPVQVNYLGYPGTVAAPYLDYIIADKTVIPNEHQIHYSEKIAHLPHAFFPNDCRRPIAEETPSRAEAGLPETGFVFACHNTPHKIGPETFDVWMRLLRGIEGSVLWLKSMDPAAMGNLWREAKARGVAPERLVFASRLPQAADHLARLRLADLFLDTLPYNAHATASDALWVGLPVLTCLGNSFPGRVAASLLHAVGLPELVTTSLAQYEAAALTLARDAGRLAALKAKLRHNRETEALFDTARFTRDLEAAYSMMWERQQAGLPPASFAVAGS